MAGIITVGMIVVAIFVKRLGFKNTEVDN